MTVYVRGYDADVECKNLMQYVGHHLHHTRTLQAESCRQDRGAHRGGSSALNRLIDDVWFFLNKKQSKTQSKAQKQQQQYDSQQEIVALHSASYGVSSPQPRRKDPSVSGAKGATQMKLRNAVTHGSFGGEQGFLKRTRTHVLTRTSDFDEQFQRPTKGQACNAYHVHTKRAL